MTNPTYKRGIVVNIKDICLDKHSIRNQNPLMAYFQNKSVS